MRAKFCTLTKMAYVGLLILAISNGAQAQTTTTGTAASEVKAESLHKFSGYIGMDYVFEPLANDDLAQVSVLEKEYKKQRAIVYPGVTYTYNKEWALSLAPEFRYNNGHQDGGYPTNPGRLEYARSLISLMRKGILNEKEHGFNFEAGYVRRVFNKGVLPTNSGNHRLRTVLSKNVNDKFNFSIFNEVLYSATKKWTNSSWKFIDNIKPTLNFTLSEKLSLSLIYDVNIAYFHRTLANQNKTDLASENHHIITYTISDMYSVGSDFKFNYGIYRNGVANFNPNNEPTPGLVLAPFVTLNLTSATSVSFEASWTYNQYNDSEEGFAPKRNFYQYPDLAIYFFHSI